MYCDEVIKKVYLGQPKYDSKGNYFLDCYFDMAIHITPEYRLIFECDSCYFSLQTDGLHKIEKTGDVSSIEKEGEWIESFYQEEDDPEEAPWVEYEYTLFSGEKIVDIEHCGKDFIVRFADFQLKVITYSTGEEIFSFYPAAYSNVLGSERLIKKCSCGGTGRLDIDFVSDYGIRCDKCHKGTKASMCAIDAIEDWNDGTNLFEIGDYPVESFKKHCFGKIEFIAIEEWYTVLEDNSIDCRSIILKVDDKLFEIKSNYSGQGQYDFYFEELSSFNPSLWPKIFNATEIEPIKFIQRETDPDGMSILRFEIGNGSLLILANKTRLKIDVAS